MPNGDPIPESTFRYGDPIITNWSQYDPSNIIEDKTIGIENIADSGAYNSKPPEGNQNAYIYIETVKIGKGEIGIQQKLSETVTIDTTYTLTVYIGNPGPGSWSTLYSNKGMHSNTSLSYGFPGYRIDLLADNNILISDSNTVSPIDKYWAQTSATITITSHNPFIGQALSIRLIHLNEAIGEEVCFDDVRLEALSYSNNNNNDNNNNYTVILAVMGSLLMICCICCCAVWIYYRKEQKNNDNKHSNIVIKINKNDTSKNQVYSWLHKIGQIAYYPSFIKAGFDSMETIQCIGNRNVLKDIGVSKMGHRVFILSEINKLRLPQTDDDIQNILDQQNEHRQQKHGLPPPPQSIDDNESVIMGLNRKGFGMQSIIKEDVQYDHYDDDLTEEGPEMHWREDRTSTVDSIYGPPSKPRSNFVSLRTFGWIR